MADLDGQASGLLRRITGESEARTTLERVARELRHRRDDLRQRRRRQRAAEIAAENPRRGVHRRPPEKEAD
ncbi:MAG: hypothetical protein E6F96_12605 [Actinobacteria bacterium]|nr:MAG: hypothetical protein E6F96_12605 [Actinomycetota bacterium]